jgi:ATP-dependent Clp protease ATP-binding subunit ClpA
MFERFTDRARRSVTLAGEEARRLNHSCIGTEHLLLGLLHENDGVAAKSLEALGISLDGVRSQVEEIIGWGPHLPIGHIPYTPRTKRVLELSLREALQLGHNYIGTEHILLALIREGEGVAAQVLVRLGAELTRVRQRVIQLLSGYQGKETAEEKVQAQVHFVPANIAGAIRHDMQSATMMDRVDSASWMDLHTHPEGNEVVVNLNRAAWVEQHHDCCVIHFPGGDELEVKENIKDIWG